MGEDAKKPAAEEEKKPKKVDEEKKELNPAEKPATEEEKPATEEKKPEETENETPPPPQEIVLQVYMHCEGCARKVRRWLKGFEGVEDVTTDCRASKVVVRGEKADPLKVLERIQRKSHREVVLISPIPKPPSEKKAEEKEKPKVEEKKEEPPVITAMLRVYMHCEACAMEIKKRIQRMQGVESAEPDLKSSQVTVKGVFEPEKLVEYVHKRTGKHAVIVKQEPEKKEEEKGKEPKEEKKGEDGDKQNKGGGGGGGGGGEQGENKVKKEGGGSEAKEEAEAAAIAAEEETTVETTVVELRKMEFYNYYPPERYEHYSPAPQIFSDENPNACTVM